MNDLAIIVTAYNRPDALKILLSSLSNLRNCENVPLIISIDNHGTDEVNRIANEFVWPFGEKEIIIHQEKKGLVKHFIWVGDQTERFEHVIFLEDDLRVSPELINFSRQLIEFYENDSDVAAASLYNPPICEATGCQFYQIQDGYDVYFFQQPYWGNIWFRKKWREFDSYLKEYKENKSILPDGIAGWERSFKKIYIQFLIEKNKYVVTPRVSLLTNMGYAGEHSPEDGNYLYRRDIMLGSRKYSFCICKNSMAKYDAFMEIIPDSIKRYNISLKNYDFDVDTKGLRTNYKSPYVLTTRDSRNAILTFSTNMKPIELSVFLEDKGNGELKLCKVSDILDKSKKHSGLLLCQDIQKHYGMGIHTVVYFLKKSFKRFMKRFYHVGC